MPILADYHMHSSFSGDSRAPMQDMAARAIALGYQEICFTEHMDLHYPASEECPEGMFLLNTDSYLYDLLRAREKFGEQINIKFGVELGLQPDYLKEISDYARSYDFDFIIGSTHVVQHQDPAFPSYYEGISTEEGYRAYFNEILTSIRSFTNFDIYGHIDYVIRYSKTKDLNYCYEQYADIFDPIIETLIANGKGIEINTGGYKAGLGVPNPTPDVIRRYRELGGEKITFGADAHKPEHIAFHFADAAAIAQEAGFRYYVRFKEKKPEYLPIQ